MCPFTSREGRKACCVSTWRLPATESFKQIHLARSDMKSKLQALGSLGMPKLRDWQQRESATQTMTAQPASMVRRGGTGEPERGGREGVSRRFRASLTACTEEAAPGNEGIAFFSPVKPSPSLFLAAHSSAPTVSEVLRPCRASSQPSILSTTFSPPLMTEPDVS